MKTRKKVVWVETTISTFKQDPTLDKIGLAQWLVVRGSI